MLLDNSQLWEREEAAGVLIVSFVFLKFKSQCLLLCFHACWYISSKFSTVQHEYNFFKGWNMGQLNVVLATLS